MRDLVAMVPVRAGSVRVPNKNIRTFGDTTLLHLKLRLLVHVNTFDEIIVSTDCEQSAEIAVSMGVKVHWRDSYFAGSSITNDLHWYHIAENTPGHTVFLAQVTSPLIRVSTMKRAIELFYNPENKDSLNSVTCEKKFLWQNGAPLNYDPNVTPKSQDLPDITSLNFAITLISRQVMMERKNVVGYNPKFFEIDKIQSTDIDDPVDFKFAELMYQDLGINWLLS